MDWILNMANLCDRKIGEGKTDSMLWLDLNKILKMLIEDENDLEKNCLRHCRPES